MRWTGNCAFGRTLTAGLLVWGLLFVAVRINYRAGTINMNPEHKLSAIRQIAITVSDVSKVLPFYRDVLGLTFLFSPMANLAFLDAGGVRLMLTTPQGAGAVGQNSILYFKVSDIVAVHAAIVGRGAKDERTPQ